MPHGRGPSVFNVRVSTLIVDSSATPAVDRSYGPAGRFS
jgi:hypothetical protein